MTKLLAPIFMLLLGAGAGLGAGMFLAPPALPIDAADSGLSDQNDSDAETDSQASESSVYIPMGDQFVVPLLVDGVIAEHVILSISLETSEDQLDYLEKKQPKLRAAFIVALYDHASLGAFSEPLQSVQMLQRLSEVLQDSAEHTVPNFGAKVLVTNFIRQNA